MSILVTERWDGESAELGSDGWSATRSFDVTGVSSELEASKSPGIPRRFELHPRSRFLAVQRVSPQRVSPNLWTVVVHYAQPGVATFGPGQASGNSLNDPSTIKWDIGVSDEPIDRDKDDNPILNSAGDSFTSNPSRPVATIFLTITRNEPFFDVRKALNFTGKVNKSGFNIKGAGNIGPRKVLCSGITPAREYLATDQVIPVSYTFELRPDGFDLRIRDQGKRANAKDADGNEGLVEILDSNRQPVSTDVNLGGNGIPIKSSSYNAWDGQSETEYSFSSKTKPSGAKLEVASGGDAYFLVWEVIDEVEFGGLNL